MIVVSSSIRMWGGWVHSLPISSHYSQNSIVSSKKLDKSSSLRCLGVFQKLAPLQSETSVASVESEDISRAEILDKRELKCMLSTWFFNPSSIQREYLFSFLNGWPSPTRERRPWNDCRCCNPVLLKPRDTNSIEFVHLQSPNSVVQENVNSFRETFSNVKLQNRHRFLPS